MMEIYMNKDKWRDLIEKYRINAVTSTCYGTKKTVLIGLAGPKGVGKTTFAHLIDGQVFSLASPIKKMLATIIPPLYIYEEKEKPIPGWPDGITGRYLLQRVGTECFREMWPEVWVTHLLNEIEKVEGLCVIDDVRFENEARAIRKKGGSIWRLHRRGVNPLDDHISEAGLPDELVDREISLNAQV